MRKLFEKEGQVAEVLLLPVQSLVIVRRSVDGKTTGDIEFEGGGWDEMDWMMEQATEKLEAEGFKLISEEAQPKDDLSRMFIEKRYGMEVPERLARFVDDKEYQKYEGFCARGMPMWSNDVVFRMRFASPAHPFLEELYGDFRQEDRGRYFPLSLLDEAGGETSEYVAVDTSDDDCPVVMWYHGSATFYPVADSLDEWLESLEENPSEKPFGGG